MLQTSGLLHGMHGMARLLVREGCGDVEDFKVRFYTNFIKDDRYMYRSEERRVGKECRL